jgi:hypothetical protein
MPPQRSAGDGINPRFAFGNELKMKASLKELKS